MKKKEEKRINDLFYNINKRNKKKELTIIE